MRGRAWIAVLLAAVLAAPASAADETRMYLVDPAHSNAVPDSALVPPLKLRWQVNLGVQYLPVLVSGGRVFYIRNPGTGVHLTALDAATGAELWSKSLNGIPGDYSLAIDGDRLYLGSNASVNYRYDLRVEALDAATGASRWIRVIGHEYGLGSHLTADAGQVFVLGSSGSTTLHALRGSDGSDLWEESPSITSGDSSAPTLDASTVYVSVAGAQTFAFDRATGEQRWHYAGCCTGGGGTTTHLWKGQLFAHDALVHDASNGQVVGNWSGAPAFSGDGGVEWTSGLRAFGPSYGTTRWTFGNATSRPLIAGQYVYSSTDMAQVYALRLSDGAPVWCAAVQMPPGSEYPASPFPIAAGHGLLIVSMGYGLAAFESGGTQADSCQPVGGGGSTGGGGVFPPPASPAAGPALTMTVGRKSLYLGQRTNVLGRLSGVTVDKATRVALDVDEHPFEGRYTQVVEAPVAADGTLGFKFAPRRNSRIRLRLAGADVTSEPADVLADFPYRVRKIGAGGRRPRIRLTVYAFRRAQIRKRVSYAYYARGNKRPWRLVDRSRWQVRTPRAVAVRLRFPRGTLDHEDDHWLICQPEPQPDGFGRASEIERRCGARTLPRGLS